MTQSKIQKKNKSIIVNISVSLEYRNSEHANLCSFDEYMISRMSEAVGLAAAIDFDAVWRKSYKVDKINSATFLGKGRCEEIATACEEFEPEIVIFNHSLTPVQQRNLEKALGCKVIDRTGLILEIFGERAQTKEGKLQVELAFLQFQRTRLVKAWTHLERQRGGAGFMGGPGETQLEIDRRLTDEKISKLKKILEQVKKTRDIQRQSRAKVPFPIVSLIGYTNAGKSTLFNKITNANVFAEDLLFATLDPTMRRFTLPKTKQEIILADTVGFISELPTTLIAAFRATLEHVINSDIIIHVKDVSSPYYQVHHEDVVKIMAELGVDYNKDKRIIEVWNKTDLVDDIEAIINKVNNIDKAVSLSALTGDGIDDLLKEISEYFRSSKNKFFIELDICLGNAIAWLHENGYVISEEYNEKSCIVEVELGDMEIGRFRERFNDNNVSIEKAIESIKTGI